MFSGGGRKPEETHKDSERHSNPPPPPIICILTSRFFFIHLFIDDEKQDENVRHLKKISLALISVAKEAHVLIWLQLSHAWVPASFLRSLLLNVSKQSSGLRAPKLLLMCALTSAHHAHLLHLTRGAPGQARVRVRCQTSLISSPSTFTEPLIYLQAAYEAKLFQENREALPLLPPDFSASHCTERDTSHRKLLLMTVRHQSRFFHTVALRNLN